LMSSFNSLLVMVLQMDFVAFSEMRAIAIYQWDSGESKLIHNFKTLGVKMFLTIKF